MRGWRCQAIEPQPLDIPRSSCNQCGIRRWGGSMESEDGESAQEPGGQLTRVDRRIWIVSIGGGVLSSAIFAIFFQPILNFLSHALVSVGSRAFSSFIDAYYATSVSASESSI